MTCPHDFTEREMADADGLCALCLQQEITRLRAARESLIETGARTYEQLVAARARAEAAEQRAAYWEDAFHKQCGGP